MLRQELQSYFDRVYPFAKIDTEYSVGGQVQIRFELGGEILENGTIERVGQATDRALQLFYDTFDNRNHLIWILIYQYLEPYSFNISKQYLHEQFPIKQFEKFYNQIEQVNTCELTVNKSGQEVLEKAEVRVIIGKLSVKEINIENIIRGIYKRYLKTNIKSI
ncbi:hypothetical protein ABIB40_000024 [Pedobacter sp. UYP30]|uniref:DUF3885 domain-containing protein n=1 Tax=Pedobacter sp. UYP30 TaxID=1756400 RepID=UPI00339A1FC3